jgi:uncharacterized protein YjbJ (UPF0337 family)
MEAECTGYGIKAAGNVKEKVGDVADKAKDAVGKD